MNSCLCGANNSEFYSLYIPINDEGIIEEGKKIDLLIFNGYYILHICTMCKRIQGNFAIL